MSLRIRQIVFAARDLKSATAQFERELGLKVAYRDPEVSKFGLENVLMPLGDQFVEIVSPVRANTTAGRHLERYGDSPYMLIFQTDDLARDRARLERLGVRIIWQANHADMHSVQLHPKDTGVAIVSLDQPTPPQSWRWAGPDWQRYVSTSGAQRVLEATIAAHDPAALAQRWYEVLGTQSPIDERGVRKIPIEDGALNFVQSDNGTDRITGYRIAMRSLSSTLNLCGTQFRT